MIKKDFIPINPFSRIGRPLREMWGIAMHYAGTPRATAQNGRDYMARLADQDPKAKKHIKKSCTAFVDEEGVIQIMPWNEEAWHIGLHRSQWHRYSPLAQNTFHNDPSKYLIGIEMCHPDAIGVVPEKTVYWAKELCVYLCWRFDLDPIERIIRHYDCTGKNCPKDWVAHPDKFEQYCLSVKAAMEYAEAKHWEGEKYV